MAKRKQARFSVVSAVKANARARVGQPPPGQVLPDPKTKRAAPRYKQTLADLLGPDPDRNLAANRAQGDSQ